MNDVVITNKRLNDTRKTTMQFPEGKNIVYSTDPCSEPVSLFVEQINSKLNHIINQWQCVQSCICRPECQSSGKFSCLQSCFFSYRKLIIKTYTCSVGMFFLFLLCTESAQFSPGIEGWQRLTALYIALGFPRLL